MIQNAEDGVEPEHATRAAMARSAPRRWPGHQVAEPEDLGHEVTGAVPSAKVNRIASQ